MKNNSRENSFILEQYTSLHLSDIDGTPILESKPLALGKQIRRMNKKQRNCEEEKSRHVHITSLVFAIIIFNTLRILLTWRLKKKNYDYEEEKEEMLKCQD